LRYFGILAAREKTHKKAYFFVIVEAIKNVTVEVNVVPHGDGGAPDLNGPPHGFKDG